MQTPNLQLLEMSNEVSPETLARRSQVTDAILTGKVSTGYDLFRRFERLLYNWRGSAWSDEEVQFQTRYAAVSAARTDFEAVTQDGSVPGAQDASLAVARLHTTSALLLDGMSAIHAELAKASEDKNLDLMAKICHLMRQQASAIVSASKEIAILSGATMNVSVKGQVAHAHAHAHDVRHHVETSGTATEGGPVGNNPVGAAYGVFEGGLVDLEAVMTEPEMPEIDVVSEFSGIQNQRIIEIVEE